jgi:hypothetical protein
MRGSEWRSRMLRACAALVIALAALVTAATPVQATSSDRTVSIAKAAEHCVYFLDKIQPGQEISRIAGSRCFNDEAAAALACTNPLATMWMDVNYSGDGYTWCGSYGTCDAAGYGFRSIGYPLANRVSSFRVYGNCTFMRMYDYVDFGGDTITCIGSRSWLPSFNDRAESFRVWRG